MDRAEAIAKINRHLDAADDALLEAVAANLDRRPIANMTVAEALETLPGPSVLPRPLSSRELELLEQAKHDFEVGRTHSLAESEAYVLAELEKRRRQRATP